MRINGGNNQGKVTQQTQGQRKAEEKTKKEKEQFTGPTTVKQCPVKEECCGKYRIRTITDYGNPSKIRMLHKMENEWAQKIYKKNQKL